MENMGNNDNNNHHLKCFTHIIVLNPLLIDINSIL